MHPFRKPPEAGGYRLFDRRRPPSERVEKALRLDLFVLDGQCYGPRDGDRPGRAARVPVGDAPLVVGRPNHLLGIVEEEQTYRARPHGASVAGRWGGRPGLLPGYAGRQAPGRLLGRLPATDDPVLHEDHGYPVRVVPGIEPSTSRVALQQLPGELRVVRVLAEREGSAPASDAPGLQRLFHVLSADLGRLALHDEPQSVAQTLADQGPAVPPLVRHRPPTLPRPRRSGWCFEGRTGSVLPNPS